MFFSNIIFYVCEYPKLTLSLQVDILAPVAQIAQQVTTPHQLAQALGMCYMYTNISIGKHYALI
jgi:hypothetical protein